MARHPSVLPFLVYIPSESRHIERMAVRAKYMTLDPNKNRRVFVADSRLSTVTLHARVQRVVLAGGGLLGVMADLSPCSTAPCIAQFARVADNAATFSSRSFSMLALLRRPLACRAVPCCASTLHRYVRYMGNIRLIQEYLVRKADKYAVPRVDNSNVDRSVGIIHLTVMR